jgi:hypothetical protein
MEGFNSFVDKNIAAMEAKATKLRGHLDADKDPSLAAHATDAKHFRLYRSHLQNTYGGNSLAGSAIVCEASESGWSAPVAGPKFPSFFGSPQGQIQVVFAVAVDWANKSEQRQHGTCIWAPACAPQWVDTRKLEKTQPIREGKMCIRTAQRCAWAAPLAGVSGACREGVREGRKKERMKQ